MTTADEKRIGATWKLLEGWNLDGHCRAIAAETGSTEGESYSFAAGQLGADDAMAVNNDSIFLIASPTKPFVATAAMMLVEQGQLQLDHFVTRYLPEFRGHGKKATRVVHLLTHTSGLPDMLPNNVDLRKKHAPLSEFMKHVYDVQLAATPGKRVHYQSMGILTLAALIEKITGVSLPDHLRDTIFSPLEMTSTELGIPDRWESDDTLARMTWSQVEDSPEATDWGWNSMYWRKLAAPWGGLLSTSSDFGRFCRHLLQIHAGEDGIIAPPTLRAMTTNQLRYLPDLPKRMIRTTPWGLGWQMNWPGHPRGFGELLPASAYGHWGATGTMVWLDPTRGAYGVVLTTEPIELENRRQIAFGNTSSLIW
ncbi:MAG: beta-lactamase family protein [Planctomycetes bacterium]|nr:beta-lactamase family protein [Planctomycetota bacterium]